MALSALRVVVGLFCLIGCTLSASATELREHLSSLRQGGFVIVLRHFATDPSQRDVVPFDFDNMRAQRQLSDQGREQARAMGRALTRLGIPIGQVFTSRLNRAVETGQLISPARLTAMDELTDSSAGNTALMAGGTGGGSEALGRALRALANAAPEAGTNTLVVTHKTNIIDAFGQQFSSIDEGEALILRPGGGGEPVFVARVPARAWLEQTAGIIR